MTRGEIARLAFAGLALLPAAPGAAAAQDAAACARPGKSFKPIISTHMQIPYPSISMRLGEQGVTMVTVAIGSDGVPSDVTVTRSSGTERLDAAVVKYVKQYWRWQPPIEDCKPATAQAPVVVNWHLKDSSRPEAEPEMRKTDYPPDAEIITVTVPRPEIMP